MKNLLAVIFIVKCLSSTGTILYDGKAQKVKLEQQGLTITTPEGIDLKMPDRCDVRWEKIETTASTKAK